MNFDDKLFLTSKMSYTDENLDIVEETSEVEPPLKCKILPNSAARKVKGRDGEDYVYTYEIFLRKPRDGRYPKENDIIRIVKKDGSINKQCNVVGFVTLKNYVKLWV